jgi:uncharacterized protein DUF2442
MKSETPGRDTSPVEIIEVDGEQLRIRIDGNELTLPFDQFPWFKGKPREQIVRIERHGTDHLHWPDLDVDLTLDSIVHPERYPLVSS